MTRKEQIEKERESLARTYRVCAGRKIFAVSGTRGAVHFWVQEYERDGRTNRYGGIEVHYRQAPDWAEGKPPCNENCWLLNAPCWHDGSSLQAEEYWIPLYRSCDPNKLDSLECIFLSLEGNYFNRFFREES